MNTTKIESKSVDPELPPKVWFAFLLMIALFFIGMAIIIYFDRCMLGWIPIVAGPGLFGLIVSDSSHSQNETEEKINEYIPPPPAPLPKPSNICPWCGQYRTGNFCPHCGGPKGENK